MVAGPGPLCALSVSRPCHCEGVMSQKVSSSWTAAGAVEVALPDDRSKAMRIPLPLSRRSLASWAFALLTGHCLAISAHTSCLNSVMHCSKEGSGSVFLSLR